MPIFAALASALPALVSTGAGIAGNMITGGNTNAAIKNAAAKQQQATDQAIGGINGNTQNNASLYAPYINSGTSALGQLGALLGLGAPSSTPAQPSLSSVPSWSAYVQNNPDVLQAYNTTGKAQGTSMDDFGQWHWNTFGNAEHQAGNPARTFTPYGQTQPAQVAQAPPPVAPQMQQQAAIDQLKASPLYQSLFHTGEQTALAQASATGGLRGGNAQAAFYNLGNQTLAQVIEQQIANLGGLAGAGQSATGALAGLNTQSMGTIAGLLGQNATAQGAAGIAGSNAQNTQTNGLLSGLGSLIGNPQILSALGLGGGIKQTTMPQGSALGPMTTLSSNYSAPYSINPQLQGVSF